MRACSKEYLTKKQRQEQSEAASQAKSFAPMNCSQLMADLPRAACQRPGREEPREIHDIAAGFRGTDGGSGTVNRETAGASPATSGGERGFKTFGTGLAAGGGSTKTGGQRRRRGQFLGCLKTGVTGMLRRVERSSSARPLVRSRLWMASIHDYVLRS